MRGWDVYEFFEAIATSYDGDFADDFLAFARSLA